MNNIEKGKLGEKIAKNFLLKNGYIFITENYYGRFGELDLIFFDNSLGNQEVVFVEVKTRSSFLYGYPEESITHKKIEKILLMVELFLDKNIKYKNIKWRVDGIFIIINKKCKFQKLYHYKNIIDG